MNLDDLAERVEIIRHEEAGIEREVRVCLAAGCQSCGAEPVFDGLKAALAQDKTTRVKPVGCMGLCCAGPLVQTHQRQDGAQVLYRQVQEQDVAEIVAAVDGGADALPPRVAGVGGADFCSQGTSRSRPKSGGTRDP